MIGPLRIVSIEEWTESKEVELTAWGALLKITDIVGIVTMKGIYDVDDPITMVDSILNNTYCSATVVVRRRAPELFIIR
jgi:hypothetical protein